MHLGQHTVKLHLGTQTKENVTRCERKLKSYTYRWGGSFSKIKMSI